MKKIIALIMILFILISGCSMFPKEIKEVKKEEMIDTKVTVSGTVENTIKLGDLSGYTLKDETDSIFISSTELPKEGDKKTVSGTLKKILIGYYIETK